MSRRKAVHVPKVWEVEEISDDDDENIEEMQKEVENILSKITNKKKASIISQETPLHFDIKVEVEEYEEQSSKTSQIKQNHSKSIPSTSQNQQTLDGCTSLSAQTTSGAPPENVGPQEPQPVSTANNAVIECKSKSILKPSTYSKCKKNPQTSQSIEKDKWMNTLQKFELNADEIKTVMENLSRCGNIADKYIYLMMRNYDYMPKLLVQTEFELAIQKVLKVWRDWFMLDIENRGAPLLYKCKSCGIAWWYLHSFREHFKTTHHLQLSRLRLEFEATKGESYIAAKVTTLPLAPAVKIVNAPCWKCGMLPGVKYKNFDTTTLLYLCKCGNRFNTCYEYRLHLDTCYKEALVKKLVNYKCHLCFLRFDTPVQLKNHRILSHTVRSDLPAPWVTSRPCKRCDLPFYYGMHDCPTVKRLVPCSFCTRKFTNQTIMKLHQGFSKENEKCRLCDHVLDRQCMELMHLVQHTDNYILLQKCSTCEYYYNDAAYKKHLKDIHPMTDEPPFKVPVPVKCLQDAGHDVPIPTDKIAVVQAIKDEIGVPQPIKDDNIDSRKRKAAQEESPPKRIKPIIKVMYNNNPKKIDTSNIKVEDQSIEEFINTENEINEMILLKNKDTITIVKMKFEVCEEGVIRAGRNELSIVDSKINSNVNSKKNKPITATSSEDYNSKNFTQNTYNKEIIKYKDDSTISKIKLENIEEDNIRPTENELNIAINEYDSDIDITSNKTNPTIIKNGERVNSVYNEMCLQNNNDKKYTKRNENNKPLTSTNYIIPEKENQDLEITNSVADSKEMIDFELHIEKNKISSENIRSKSNQVVTNIIMNSKIDDNNKIKDTSNKSIYNEPQKNKCLNVSEKEIPNPNIIGKVQNNKEDDNIRLKENECLVNRIEVNTNKSTQELSANKEIIYCEGKELQHVKDMSNETSTNHNVPNKESHNPKQFDYPGPSTKSIKIEQEDVKVINENIKIKEEILENETDDEKLVIAEFNDLIRDKSVKLEVKEELEECFEDDMIVWGSNIHKVGDEDVDVGTSNDYEVWTPHLGVVRSDVSVEIENLNSEDDDDLSFLDIKSKKKVYRCIRSRFSGNHRQYTEHKKRCTIIHKSTKKFIPANCNHYKCTTCTKEYSTLIRYLRHFPAHGYKPLQCPLCMMVLNSGSKLESHVAYHINKNYLLIRGILAATDDDFKMQCARCPTEVQVDKFFLHWERHLSLQMQERNNPIKKEDFAPESPILRELIALIQERCGPRQQSENKKLRWCKMCSRRFTRNSECKRHYIEHLLDDAFSRISQVQGLRCQICGDVWQKPGDFRHHIRGHASMPVYRCELCGKSFSDSSNFAKHRKVHNLGVYACDVCSKKFSRKRTLIEHFKHHDKQKPIKCSLLECDKVFYTQAEYKKHCRVTHGPMKFSCQICKTKYDSLREMWDHQWEDHKVRKIIADCPLCDMKFRKFADVKAHVRAVHTTVDNFSMLNLKRLNTLSPSEKSGNVAHLLHDVAML